MRVKCDDSYKKYFINFNKIKIACQLPLLRMRRPLGRVFHANGVIVLSH